VKAADERLWRPRPPVPLERLTVWITGLGAPAVVRDLSVGPGLYVVASTLASIDVADAPGGSRAVSPGAADAVLALVPAHHGLVVDKASADPIVISAAEVDQLRPRPIPYGTEADAAFHLPPPHVVSYLPDIRRAAKPAGAGRVTATWTLFPDSVPALLLIVKPARNADAPAALDAVYRAVEQLAPPETVRVVDAGTLSRGQLFRTLGGQRLVESPAPDPDPYSAWQAAGPGVDQRTGRRASDVAAAAGKPPIRGRTPFNLALGMVGAMSGAFVVSLPREFGWHGVGAVAAVVVGVAIVAVCVGVALWDFFRQEP
jgi:hypothetical protein